MTDPTTQKMGAFGAALHLFAAVSERLPDDPQTHGAAAFLLLKAWVPYPDLEAYYASHGQRPAPKEFFVALRRTALEACGSAIETPGVRDLLAEIEQETSH